LIHLPIKLKLSIRFLFNQKPGKLEFAGFLLSVLLAPIRIMLGTGFDPKEYQTRLQEVKPAPN